MLELWLHQNACLTLQHILYISFLTFISVVPQSTQSPEGKKDILGNTVNYNQTVHKQNIYKRKTGLNLLYIYREKLGILNISGKYHKNYLLNMLNKNHLT